MEPNTKLGNYEVIEKIGAGGMGEVYRARDTRLGRDVALKLLPAIFADDPDRLGRFEREARLLAALNHPNIAAIYGLEHADGKRFLVLELVQGDDLSARIAQGPVPLEEALPIARDIAEALEYAHEQGIVHRDLKPANIKLTPEGRVKVLDFGLAKALESEDGTDPRLSQSPTVLASSPTIAGVILGTAAYMSPEQARGKSVDKRSDVFAFGAVLYEMLTGTQAFMGDTVSDTLASVLKTQPDAGVLPENTPRAIRELLKRCLEKDARLRLRDIGEARIAIDTARHGGTDEAAVAAPAATPVDGAARFRANLVWGVATLAIASAAFFASRLVTPAHNDAPLRKLAIEAADDGGSLSSMRVALSPDGKRIAYVANDRLWVRELSKLEATEIPGTEKAEIPFWSPDGTQVGYRIGSTFYRVGASGGNGTIVSATNETFTGGSGAQWTGDDRIIFTTGAKGILEVPALGGDPVEIVPRLDGETDIHEPGVLPGGRGILFVPHYQQGGPRDLVVYADGKRKILLSLPNQRIWTPRYSSTGHILFRRTPNNSGIWALPFSLSKLEATGEPFLVALDGSEPCPGPDGMLVYRAGGGVASMQFAWIARDGTMTASLSDVFDNTGRPTISPDGGRFAGIVNEGNNNGDIFVFDLARGTRQRLSFDPAWDIEPEWSPDGKAVYYVCTKDGMVRMRRADGTGDEQLVIKGWSPNVSPDGKWLLVDDDDPNSISTDIFMVALPADTSSERKLLIGTKKNEQTPRVSPSGRYLAYESDESGRDEIYLTRFPGAEGKWQVSVSGGTRARWDPAGGHLYFTSDTALMEVDVTEEPELRLGNPRQLFLLDDARVYIGRTATYDVERGGKRFIMCYNASSAAASPKLKLIVAENWPAEFEKSAKK
jgi:Tol biopolymer transport system component